MLRLWTATQKLAAEDIPVFHLDRLRLDQRTDGGPANLYGYFDHEGKLMQERNGSYHFVQAWPQKGHPNEVSSRASLVCCANSNLLCSSAPFSLR